ncbi:MAG: hypothetical protein ACPGVP_21930, partial [Thiolinea sp.]
DHYEYLYSVHQQPTPQQPMPESGIDWDTVAEIIPPLVAALAWLLWGLFLLIPSLFGLHYAPLFSDANNAVFVAMGFVLCMALSSAVRAGHGVRAIVFLMGLSLLSFWF